MKPCEGMYRLHKHLITSIVLCLVFSYNNKLNAHNEITHANSNDVLINNDSSDLIESRGHLTAHNLLSSSKLANSNSFGSSSSLPLSTSPVSDGASSRSPTHTLPSPSSKPLSDKSDESSGDSKFYKTLCSTNRMQPCENLSIDCLDCAYDYTCDFGELKTVECRVKENVECQGSKTVNHNYTCAYCYQFPETNYHCTPSFTCRINSRYLTDCSMKSHVLCLGNRSFQRYKICNFVSGYKWSTALLLSVTFGGFGIDRFYLGYWQEGIGKLFSFGGFGVWTLVDIILIATGYLKPADGSRYINDFSFS